MSDFMAVVPLFYKALGTSPYKPFLLNFTPFSIRQVLALFGNFVLVESPLILFIYAVFPFLLDVYLRYFLPFKYPDFLK